MFKKMFVLGMILVLIFPLISFAAETRILRAVTAWPRNATDNKAFFIFFDLVEEMVAKNYPGQLKINYIGGPETIKSMDQAQAVQRGIVDMAFLTTAYYVSILPEVDAIKLSEFSAPEERQRSATKFINELHEKKLGVVYLARLGLDIKFNLYLKKPIQKADLKGLNIRVSPMYLQAIKGLGGNPVVIPPTDVFLALERGVVDGYCWPEVGIRDWGWEKHTKYVVEPGFYRVPNPLIVNKKVFDSLPRHLKDLLIEAATEAEKRAYRLFSDLARKERPELKKVGIEVLELPPAEKEKFLKIAYEEGWKDILQKVPKEGAELKKYLTREQK